MKQHRIRLTLIVVSIGVFGGGFAGAAELDVAKFWSHWRGPTGNSISPHGQPPVSWSDTKNVKWKVPIPGHGSASPIIWQAKVFIATAVPAGNEKPAAKTDKLQNPRRFTLLCLDRATGKTVWEKVAAETRPHEGHHGDHDYASASPCTDGERVYAHFGSRGLFCYDLEGELQWKKTDFGQMKIMNQFGEGSSPTLHDDTIIVPWDHEGQSYLIALDKKTGVQRWKTQRDEPTNWATPLVVEYGGKKQVVMNGEHLARGYDFATGEELWSCPGQVRRPVASPVAGHGLVFVGSGHKGAFLAAFRLDGRGDLKGTESVAWSLDRQTPDIPSPLLSGRRLFFHAGKTGTLSCHDAVTGKKHFTERVEGLDRVYASPVGANGKIYLTARDGTTVVVEDAETFKIVATNHLPEGIDATPAIAGDQIFLRTRGHLYCVEK